MPELPEVETVMRSIAPLVRNRSVLDVWTSGLPLHLCRPVDEASLRRLIAGAQVKRLQRRGKYILLHMARASDVAVVLVHLGMSGRLLVAAASQPRAAHTHVVLSLNGGKELRFVDPRRFGQFKVAGTMADLPELAGMGPEPFGEAAGVGLAASLASCRAPIKAFLLDQRRLAGVGNIYACEALFELGVHPNKRASRLVRRAPDVLASVRMVLQRGLDNRGTTLRDYVDGTGNAGGNQSALKVYGREGKPCLRCAGVVRRRVDAGRSTFFCPGCQKR